MFFLFNRMKITMGKNLYYSYFHTMSFFFHRIITQEEFVRGCMADRVLYQMLTASTSEYEQ